MPQDGLVANSENLSDFATAKSFAEFLDSVWIGTSVGVAATYDRLTVPDS
jgi:hypothetical protein